MITSELFYIIIVDEVRATGDFYLIPKTTRNNGGRYVCTADNGVGNTITHEVLLTVNCKFVLILRFKISIC